MFLDDAAVVIAVIQVAIGIRLGRLDFKERPFLVVCNRFSDASRISRSREIDDQDLALAGSCFGAVGRRLGSRSRRIAAGRQRENGQGHQ